MDTMKHERHSELRLLCLTSGRGEARRTLREGKVSPRLKEQSYLNPVRKFLSTDPPCMSRRYEVAAEEARADLELPADF